MTESMRQASNIMVSVGLLGLVFAIGTGGCDRESRGAGDVTAGPVGAGHPAVERARAFLDAVKYRDVEGAWSRHIESTRGGVYCASEAFGKVLERTRAEKTERDCKDARKIGPKRRAALDRDAELLLQILRFACAQPDGDCVDYAKRVFQTQMPKSDLWRGLESYRVRRFESEGDTASLYVDFWRGRREASTVRHRTIELRTHGGKWYVTTGPGGPSVRHLPEEDAVR